MGEVDDAHHAEYEREPHRDERVDPTQENGGNDELGDYVHGRPAMGLNRRTAPQDGPGAPAGSAGGAGRYRWSQGPSGIHFLRDWS